MREERRIGERKKIIKGEREAAAERIRGRQLKNIKLTC